MFRSVYFGSISPAWAFFLEGTVATGVPGGASGVPKGRMWGAQGLGRRTPTFQRTRVLVPNYFPARREGASLDVIERKCTGEKGLLYRRAAIGPSAIGKESVQIAGKPIHARAPCETIFLHSRGGRKVKLHRKICTGEQGVLSEVA